MEVGGGAPGSSADGQGLARYSGCLYQLQRRHLQKGAAERLPEVRVDPRGFDDGGSLQPKNGAEGSGASLGKFNWLNAVVRVAYINLAVAQAFTPPTMAFAAAAGVT